MDSAVEFPAFNAGDSLYDSAVHSESRLHKLLVSLRRAFLLALRTATNAD